MGSTELSIKNTSSVEIYILSSGNIRETPDIQFNAEQLREQVRLPTTLNDCIVDGTLVLDTQPSSYLTRSSVTALITHLII